jgi:carbonic anhydrase
VQNLIVMGHAMCGGIRVLLDETAAPAGDFLVPWMRIAEPARRRVLQRAAPDPQAECERESVKLSLENLHTFPWIAERAAAGSLTLAGAMFDIRSGLLHTLTPDGAFEPV